MFEYCLPFGTLASPGNDDLKVLSRLSSPVVSRIVNLGLEISMLRLILPFSMGQNYSLAGIAVEGNGSSRRKVSAHPL